VRSEWLGGMRIPRYDYIAWVNMLTTTATGKRAAELAEADLFASVPEKNYLGLQDADGFLLG